MRLASSIRFSFASLVLAGAAIGQTTWYVQAGSPAPGSGSSTTPFPTIMDGVTAAIPGDTVEVGPGVYPESVDFAGKAIQVVGTAGAAATIIDLFGAEDAAVKFISGEGPGSRLAGFTLRRGNGSALWGAGGIVVWGGAPTIEDCVVAECTASYSGSYTAAAVFCHQSGAVFRRCLVAANVGIGDSKNGGTQGGIVGIGWHASGVRTRFENCVITNNIGGRTTTDPGAGGAAWMIDAQNPNTWAYGWFGAEFVGCIIAGNQGGGVGGAWGHLSLTNCTVVGNYGGAGWDSNYSSNNIATNGWPGGLSIYNTATNCIVRDNVGGPGGVGYGVPSGLPGVDEMTGAPAYPPLQPFFGVSYCNVKGGFAGVGNVDEDPLLVNYRPTAVSAGVDGGTNAPGSVLPATDIDGNPRVRHMIVDMGAFESPFTTRRGAVGLSSGRPYSSLKVGGADRQANVALGQSSVVSLTPLNDGPGPACFAVFGYVGSPADEELLVLPAGVGELSFPPAPLAPWHPALFLLADNLFGFAAALPSTAAPATIVIPPLGFVATFTLQAVIDDPSSGYGCSVTNAVTVTVGS